MTPLPSEVAGALTLICRGRPVPPAACSLPLVPAVRRHRVAPLAHLLLARHGEDELAALLEPDLLDAVGGHARNLAALRHVGQALSGLAWATVKGPVLSELAHPVPGVRSYTDLDVVVAARDLATAIERLTGSGWRLLDRHHALVLARMPGEVHLLGPYGAQVDLHWSLVNSARVRAQLCLRTEALLERRVTRQVEQLALPTLDDEDTLLHLCLHAALAGADRLLWLLDVDQWVRRYPPRWEVLVDRARHTGTRLAAVVVLGRAMRALETPVPPDVLVALDRRGLWRRLDRVAARVPSDVSPDGRSPARLLARASRASTGQSVTELVRRALAAAEMPKADPESAWADRPDESAWREYLSRVRQRG